MKKSFLTAGILLSIFTLLTVTACKLDVQQEKKLNRPEVEFVTGGVQIRGTYGSNDVKYINIYRQNVTGATPGDPVNIGIIFPSGFDKNDKTFAFIDTQAIEAQKYQYFCRYCDERNDYYVTNLTDKITITSGYGLSSSTTEASLLVDTGSATFKYDEDSKSFDISSGITMPTHTPAYDLALVIKSETQTQAFLLKESSSISGSMSFALASFLPEDFLNKEIQLVGLIGQYKEYSDPADPTSAVKRIYWTGIKTFTLTNTDATPVAYTDNKITVDTSSGNTGIDYGF